MDNVRPVCLTNIIRHRWRAFLGQLHICIHRVVVREVAWTFAAVVRDTTQYFDVGSDEDEVDTVSLGQGYGSPAVECSFDAFLHTCITPGFMHGECPIGLNHACVASACGGAVKVAGEDDGESLCVLSQTLLG